MAMLVSLDRVKKYLNKAAAKTQEDEFLLSLIEEYSAEFESECGQPIQQATISFECFGSGRPTLTLPFRRVTALTAIEYLEGMEWMTIPTSGYILTGNQIVSEGGFRKGSLYRFTVTVGYALESMPADISKVIRDRVVIEYFDAPAGKGRLGVTSEKEPAGTDGEAKAITYDRSKAAAAWSAAVRRHGRLP